MQFKSIILAIVASAVAIQAADPPTYDTCLNEISKIFEGSGSDDLIWEIMSKTNGMGCGICFSYAALKCGPVYVTNVNTDETLAKNCYTQTIAKCKNDGNFVPAPATVPAAAPAPAAA